MAVPAPQGPAGLTPERWARLESIFQAALDCEPARRQVLVAEACGSDAVLRAQVEGLLKLEGEAAGFLDTLRKAVSAYSTQPLSPRQQPEFTGTERFQVRRKLGSGGFGAVYEVFDREQNAILALKVLHGAGASMIERLKTEFRSLADIAHPNLVCFHELLCDDERWFFTMERVDGTDFLDYVRPGGNECDLTRLRDQLAQLVGGVQALHDFGKLHRDLKPSNVLVSHEGRLVIVDFGLISDFSREERVMAAVAGTPRYLAPELLGGAPPSPASDWYSVGVMLFDALRGNPAHLIPKDLEKLCEALRQPDPRDRPTGRDLLRITGHSAIAEAAQASEIPFVGRGAEMRLLQQILEEVIAGGSAAVLVTGGSGAGKTALVRHFLNQVSNVGGALVFAGRCYAQESIPFNSFDELAGAIAEYLRGLPPEKLRSMADRDVTAAARLFPVLQSVLPENHFPEFDSPEARQAAFYGFRSMLGRLRGPLVLYIDDLQWSSADSLQLLLAVLRQPRIPGLFFIATVRDDGNAQARIAQDLEAAGCVTHTICLGPLDDNDARLLSEKLLGSGESALVRESAGNPYLLVELARHARSPGGAAGSVEEMLQSRVALLPLEAVRLLETVAVAGERIGSQIAWRATRQEGPLQSALAVLRAQHLIQVHRRDTVQEIETYHDRVRETVERGLTAGARVDLHLKLAVALEDSGSAKPQRLALHFRAGQEKHKARKYSLAAAEEAYQSLAFETAAQWFRSALELSDGSGDDHKIRCRLAEALSSAGRGAEAARLFLECMQSAAPGERMALQRRAAADFLVSGHTQDGLMALDHVLRDIGMSMPETALRATPGFLWDRIRIRLRGLKFRERPAVEIRSSELDRIDACWCVAQGLGMVDTIRAARFHARNLLLALNGGDAYRAARALAVEAALVAILKGLAPEETGGVLRRAEDLAKRSGHAHAVGLVQLAAGMVAFLGGQWAQSHLGMQQAEELLREQCTGVAWELATARLVDCVSLFFLGEIRELRTRLPRLVENSRSRGDRYESTDLQIRIAHAVYLADNRPDTAQAEVHDAISQWPAHYFYVQHWWAFIAETEIALYRGDAEGAWRLVMERWSSLRRSLLMGVQYIKLESLFHRGAAALALACVGGREQEALFARASADAKKIEREKAAWATPMASVLRAGVAAARGDRERSFAYLRAAAAGFDSAAMGLYAAAARRRIGEITSGDEGKRAIEEADAWMTEQQIRNPERMAQMLVPGRFSP